MNNSRENQSSSGLGSSFSNDERKPKKTTVGFDITGSQAASNAIPKQNSLDNYSAAGSFKSVPINIDSGKNSKNDLEVFEMSPLSRTALQYTYSSPSESSSACQNIILNAQSSILPTFNSDKVKLPINNDSESVTCQPKVDDQKHSQKPTQKQQLSDKKAELAQSTCIAQHSVEENKKKATQRTEKNFQSFTKKTSKQVSLFSHLPQYDKENSAHKISRENIHPAIVKLALMYSENLLIGANTRCIAMLEAFKQIIQDYKTPTNALLNRHLDAYLKPQINFLVQFRPLAISMGNAIRYLKCKIAELSPDLPEEQCKEHLFETINLYIQNRINLADELIAQHGNSKINNGDVIMVYSSSETVVCLLKKAVSDGKKFKVIVVDSRPFFEGKLTLAALLECGIDCTYILLPAIGYVMREVTKIFTGAHAVFSNGYLMSRVGTALIATLAKDFNIPFCVVCETYKFIDRAQIDSFVYNEIGDPNDLVNEVSEIDKSNPKPIMAGWKDIPSLKLLNIMYDVTPDRNITAIITEVGMLPCSSVPVVLREYRPYST